MRSASRCRPGGRGFEVPAPAAAIRALMAVQAHRPLRVDPDHRPGLVPHRDRALGPAGQPSATAAYAVFSMAAEAPWCARCGDTGGTVAAAPNPLPAARARGR